MAAKNTQSRLVPFWKTTLHSQEAQSVSQAVLDGLLSQGPLTQTLEEHLSTHLNVPYTVMTTSGSMALLMSLLACGIKAGDEVIVPNRTFIATAHAPQLLGAQVVLCDCLPHTPLIDPKAAEALINPKTKAIIPVHLNGRCCPMRSLRALAEKHRLFLIEDAAQALFSQSKGRFMGSFGHFGCFSLGVTKFLTSGQGGFVVTHSKTLYQRLRTLRTHGVLNPQDETFTQFGFNFRYTDMQASIALEQLQRLEEKKEKHQALYKRYEETLQNHPKIQLLKNNLDSGELPLWVEVLCNEREALIQHLKKAGIQSRTATQNLSSCPHLKCERPFPHSDTFEKTLLMLPCGPDQEEDDISYTLKTLKQFE